MDLKNVISMNALSIVLNPLSPKWKRPRHSRLIRFTKDILRREDCDIDNYTYGQPMVIGHPGIKLRIGKFCSIARGVVIQLGGIHRTDLGTTYPFEAFVDIFPKAAHSMAEDVGPISKGDVTIGNDVWIGQGSMILSGVTVGDGVVIGAGAIVTRNIEPYSIVAGNPARLIRKRFDENTIKELLQIRWWDWPTEIINENLQIIYDGNVLKMRDVRPDIA